jgi:hypothetical protein
VPDKQLNNVTRVDPRTNRVLEVTGAGAGAFQALPAFGSVWVPSYAGSDVWRFR